MPCPRDNRTAQPALPRAAWCFRRLLEVIDEASAIGLPSLAQRGPLSPPRLSSKHAPAQVESGEFLRPPRTHLMFPAQFSFRSCQGPRRADATSQGTGSPGQRCQAQPRRGYDVPLGSAPDKAHPAFPVLGAAATWIANMPGKLCAAEKPCMSQSWVGARGARVGWA